MKKRSIAVILAALMLCAALASCAGTGEKTSANVTVTSSDAYAAADWLAARLETIPDRLMIGTDASKYGVDVSSLETDGYIIRSFGGEVALFAKTAAGLDRAVRRYAKAVEAGETIADETFREGAPIGRVTIAGNDIKDYAIRVECENEYLKNRVASLAAQGFSDLMKSACGVAVPFGDAPHAVVFRKIDDESFGEATFRYYVKDGDLVFEYVELQGANYGVWSFFEDQLGWEEIACGETHLAEADHVDVGEGTERFVDPLIRSGFNAYDGSGYNTSRNVGRTTGSAAVSNMYSYKSRLPVAMHGMQNNRWAGHDSVQWFQICYSDEALYDSIFDRIYTYVVNKLEAGEVIGEGLNYVDVAQGDNLSYCKCKDCLRTNAEEGGAWSGAVVRWTNRLDADMDAEGLEGLKYLIYAYHGTNIPCKTKPSPDVFVTLCMDGSCSRHLLDGSQCQWESFNMAGYWGKDVHLNNVDYASWIRGWGELCDSDNLYVWYYMLNNNVRSYTLIDLLWEDMHLLSDSGVTMVFVEGETYSGYGPLWLQHKIMTELQLHPEITREEYRLLVARVFENAFGDGWREALAAMDIWAKAQLAVEKCANCWGYGTLTSYDNLDGGTLLADWDEALGLLDTAIYKANSAAEEINLKRLSLSFLYNGCYYGYFPAYEADDADMLAKIADRYDLMVRRFAEVGLDHKAINGLGGGDAFVLGDTVGQTAWTVWKEDRAKFFDDGVQLRPAPAEYAGTGD